MVNDQILTNPPLPKNQPLVVFAEDGNSPEINRLEAAPTVPHVSRIRLQDVKRCMDPTGAIRQPGIPFEAGELRVGLGRKEKAGHSAGAWRRGPITSPETAGIGTIGSYDPQHLTVCEYGML